MGDTSTVYHTAQGLTLEANSSPIENSLSVVPRRSGKIGITTDNKIASTNNPEDTISRHLDFDPRHDVILLREPTPTARVYLRFSSTQRYAVLHNRDNPGVTLGWLRGRQRPVCLFVISEPLRLPGYKEQSQRSTPKSGRRGPFGTAISSCSIARLPS